MWFTTFVFLLLFTETGALFGGFGLGSIVTSTWSQWSVCSQPCGGGTRTRDYSHSHRVDTQVCNEVCLHGQSYSGGKCQCRTQWRQGRCCETCQHKGIDNCKPGRQECGGKPDNIRCIECHDPYYSAGYGNGCRECKIIEHCEHRQCTNNGNTKCLKCFDEHVFFELTTSDTKCERRCAWNNHLCWPGTCGDHLTKSCKCSGDFTLVNKTTETSCQPSRIPSLETCLTTFIGSNGEKKQSKSGTSSSACKDYQDVYGNFQVTKIKYDLVTEFSIPLSNATKPAFVEENNFGVTDAILYVDKVLLSGTYGEVERHILLEDKTKSTLVKKIFASNGLFPSGTFPESKTNNYHLQNGEWLCARYESMGGGYIKGVDTSKPAHIVQKPTPYQKTTTTKSICYRFDNASPEHCKATNTCTGDPIFIQDRITRSQTVTVYFKDWFDPIPNSGNRLRASSIESYQIYIHETDTASKDKVKVAMGNIFTDNVNATVTSMTLTLPDDSPRLYCIALEVKDVADNVKQARRFVLYDNTSFIESNPNNPIYVKSASPNTNYTWQTHHNDICIDWKGHFFNKLYPEASPLNPIESDPNGFITGVYDQTDGVLPVSGTENVYGIIGFSYLWGLMGGNISKEIKVPNYINQSYCKHFDVRDGQTYFFNVLAIDIVNNTLASNTTVRIDRTVPHIKNMWLLKAKRRSLFVHDSKELSSMSLYFEAHDPHSGILNINWAFGTTDSGVDLLTGILSPEVLKDPICPLDTVCYCPDIGNCEMSNYSIPLNKLVAVNKNVGNHNRNYYFSIKATNNALLSNIEHVEILVDDSPPETGTIFEGPTGSPDIDYTNDNAILVNWHGFIDHESGIKLYRIGIALRCLDKNELIADNGTNAIVDFAEVPYTIHDLRLLVNETGTFFVTIIAMNNAMDSSKAVCSDGITIDVSPPSIHNLTLLHAGWSETIGCIGGIPWFVKASLIKEELELTPTCLSKCSNSTERSDLLSGIPHKSADNPDADVSDFLCQTLPIFNGEHIIYIPDDSIMMQWSNGERESQLNDYFVGFGIDASEEDSPSIVGYTSTGRRPFFKRRHEGIGSNSLFYIFLKAVSKAGLSKVLTIGPVIIDVTPPLNTGRPVVNVSDVVVQVSWDNATFYDNEQVSPIDKIMFHFATDDGAVSPLHEWRLDTYHDCILCFKYPLERLQAQNNDGGQEYFVQLYVFNSAGHFLDVKSKRFRLPSTYSPGHALVYDLDPDSNNFEIFPEDVDLHYTPSTLCVAWNGFKHHENAVLEIGVGLNTTHDNVVQFYKTNSTNKECINSTKIQSGRRYYVLVRAISSGGETISSSNGITVLNATNIVNAMKVKIGKGCQYQNTIYSRAFQKANTGNNIPIDLPLQIGSYYSLFIYSDHMCFNDFEFTSNTAIVNKVNHLAIGSYISFVPLAELPLFEMKGNYTHSNVSSFTVCLRKCGDDTTFLPSSDQVSVYWYFDRSFPTTFRYDVRLTSLADDTNSSISVIDNAIAYDNSESNQTVTLNNLDLLTNDTYYVEVGICKHSVCFGSVFSETFELITEIPVGTIDVATVSANVIAQCLEISAIWKEFSYKGGIMFYTWAISRDDEAIKLLTNWNVQSETGKTTYEVNECLPLPVYAASTMYMCVRGYSNARIKGMTCRRLSQPGYNTTPIDTVYDFDTTSMQWENIKKMLHSSDIGSKMSLLHDNELNVGTTETVTAGAMLYATERMVSWYLMTSKYTPVSCNIDDKCTTYNSTDVGYVTFPSDKVRPNIAYYICVHANETTVNREFHTEILPEMTSCSNGFVIDGSDPKPGEIIVENKDSYITTRDIDVTWKDFTDNIDETLLGYPRNISHYQIRIGNTPGADGIVKAKNTSDRTLTANNLNIQDGSTIYISVTAFDYLEQSTTLISDGYILDTSPPRSGSIILGNGVIDGMYSTSNDITLQLVDFEDQESGIDHFEIAIGSSKYSDDVKQSVLVYTDHVELHFKENNTIDGHKYFIGIRAVNRAGLKSKITSVSIIFDKTPPEAGQVMDGNWYEKKDIDFQAKINVIYGHWTGFSDQQSGISYYRVGLGTRPYADDIKSLVSAGLDEDTYWRGPFIVGQKYYITVEACNGADLCRQLSSDGIILDNSPPISGTVRVGPDSRHQQYLPHNSSIRLQWTGFEDPHSGIERFEACIGEFPFSCDILPFFTCLMQSSIIKTGINLPIGKELYATVIAYNKIGMNVTQTSDYFIIDQSAPRLVVKPGFLLDYNAYSKRTVQWEKSVLRIHWEFTDHESPIIRNVLTLLTHHEGHTPVENMEVGNVNKVTINLDGNNWLHNGDTYSVLVTCCNAAGHCSTEQSPDLLIDSTPPQLGGFKPPMSWTNVASSDGNAISKLNLTWYGFHDAESDIETYYLTASRSFSGQELTHGVINVVANKSLTEEGAHIELAEGLIADDMIVLSIWAQNEAGLNSTIGRITVDALLTSKKNGNKTSQYGILDIQKHSCEVHFCNKECTCAVLGQPCVDTGNVKPCQPVNDKTAEGNSKYQRIIVSGGLQHMPQTITASSACLSGHWISDPANFTHEVIRYEWSVGLVDQPVGEGIFDLKSELPWQDNGLHTHFVHCLRTNQSLEHGNEYVIYVRAWYDFDVYKEYRSTPICVDNTAPTLRRGRYVKDSDTACIKDFDYIDWTNTITACWDKVFAEPQGEIIYFTLSLGTSPKADDVFSTTNVNLNTSFTLHKLGLRHGTHYYFTVTAYNNVGIHKTTVSDGFIVDTDNPTPGIVFNTKHHNDKHFQNTNEYFSISWHGFEDHYSGIRSYFVALSKDNAVAGSNLTFINVGLKTRYTFTNILLSPELSYVGVVKAIDAAGHFSPEVRSSSKKIDITPPKGYTCTHYELFEQHNQTDLREMNKNFTFSLNGMNDSLFILRATVLSDETHFKANFLLDRLKLRLPVSFNNDGSREMEYSFFSPFSGEQDVVLRFDSVSPINGSASISRCSNMVLDEAKAVLVRQMGPKIISVNVLVKDEESEIRKVRIGMGSTPGGFQLYPLSPIHGGTNSILSIDATHASSVYVTAIAENHAGLVSVYHAEPIIMDHTPPEIYDVTVLTDITSSHNFSRVQTKWNIRENESGIKACYCAIGNSQRSSSVVQTWMSNSLVSCQSDELHLQHGVMIYVTIRCVNNVELATEIVSNPFVVALQPPKTDNVKLSFGELDKVRPNVETGVFESGSTYIQTNDTHVQIEWSGFSDKHLIDHYEYRLLNGDKSVVDWTSSGLKTMVIIAGHDFVSGETYTAELKAFNGRFGSKVVRASLLICKDPPKLTGRSVLTTRSGANLNIDWSGVFQTPQSVGTTSVYSLTIGSRPGFNDVIEEHRMSVQSLDILIPKYTIVSEEVKEVFIAITCYLSTGMTETYEANYKL